MEVTGIHSPPALEARARDGGVGRTGLPLRLQSRVVPLFQLLGLSGLQATSPWPLLCVSVLCVCLTMTLTIGFRTSPGDRGDLISQALA